MSDDHPETIEQAVGESRRTFVKRLVLGSAFAVPVVSSFTMSGISAVFGEAPSSFPTGASGGNTNPSGTAQFPQQLNCFTYRTTGFSSNVATNPNVSITIPPNALPDFTRFCIYAPNLGSLQPDVPNGTTPVGGMAVLWNAVDGTHPDPTVPIVLTVAQPGVQSGDQIYVHTPGSVTPHGFGTTSNGFWNVNFDFDPSFVVTNGTPIVTPPGGGGGGSTPPTGGGAPAGSGSGPTPVVADPTTTG